jgi:hypothetical protein
VVRFRAALCAGTLTVNVEVAPALPGVIVDGANVKVAPWGKLVALSVTALVNVPFTEVIEIWYLADAPGGISCAEVWFVTLKSAVTAELIVRLTAGEVASVWFASPP